MEQNTKDMTQTPTKPVKKLLSCIYKASDCCDLTDCETAIDRIYEYFGNEGIKKYPAVLIRLNSLIVKKQKYVA